MEEDIAAQVLKSIDVIEWEASKVLWLSETGVNGIDVVHHVEDGLQLKKGKTDLLSFSIW
jgi:hypothetical protein